MGRNHHTSLQKYIRKKNAEEFIHSAYWFVSDRETDLMHYFRLRSGLVFWQDKINKYIHFNKTVAKRKAPDKVIYEYKQQHKRLSRALNCLDYYMQNLVD